MVPSQLDSCRLFCDHTRDTLSFGSELLRPLSKAEWCYPYYQKFAALILDPERPFPCYFAARSFAKGALLFSHLRAQEIAAPRPLYNAIVCLISHYKQLVERAALIAFVDTRDRLSLEDEQKAFWRLFQNLNHLDHSKGSSDPDDPLWVWNLANTPLFVTAHSRFYQNRLSRHAPGCLTLIIQTQENFLNAQPASAPKIRAAIDRYDRIPRSPLLGTYGDPHIWEWKQFWLPDDNETEPTTCPLKEARA